VLPPPLTPPLPTPVQHRARVIPWFTLAGAALLLIGVIGAIVWFGALSPFGFVRFSFASADFRTIDVSRSGTYLVFDERPGATDPDLPPRLSITLMDPSGRQVPVEDLVAPGTRAAPFGYHVPPNEGRAIARFTAPREGSYLLRVTPLASGGTNAADYRDAIPTQLAIGRELAWPWLRSPLGLLVLGVLPMLAGVAVLLQDQRRRRRRRSEASISESPLEPVR
jgi:hypothetical protein